ncbi:MAG: hypothetical protein A3F83_14675 [Candidatus Glassbacteria bacterium RIFCSPLOWO2_12_FULL_58_11]|uniref:Uncharacterized protein n=1 Tax=Candidatus Glassbacteria bacterium RIFCSPLOWO2_12_FULL_58_11 TaxID=1817867 RepID=A0A1F5YLG6_9BACT|nr:MAG: hypothetical protein A3F83_14675 [Candidatus Glassbacteria bacterium RIFCSPLOWO2_12_FULL_58_11]
MKKMILGLTLALTLAGLAGCHLSVYRLDKRLEKWNSMKDRSSVAVEKKVRFARESITFFLTNTDFQRSKEIVISEAERLTYHRRMCSMQVFLMDYYASRALACQELSPPDWQEGREEWNLADTVAFGKLPGLQSVYVLVHLQFGYSKYIRDIAENGDLYERMERDYPGLMAALRKMSEFQFRYAEYLMDQGRREEAIEAYLKVFVRDPENFVKAERIVKNITGRGIRENYNRQFWAGRSAEGFDRTRSEIYSMVDNVAARIEHESGADSVQAKLPGELTLLAENFQVVPEQLEDVYYYTLHERQGTLTQYVLLMRTHILKGYPPLKPTLIF